MTSVINTGTTPQYSVTSDVNIGIGTVPTDATAYTSGSTVTILASPSLTRSGYIFGGWSLTSTGVAVTSFNIAANTTLYVRWMFVSTTLGTPVPVWPNVLGSNNDDLTWSSISGATGYKVRTCTAAQNGMCVPSTLVTTTSATSYGPSLSTGSALCITVTATIDVADSSVSGTKCVSRPGGTYIHY